jgi:hypothetical protein
VTISDRLLDADVLWSANRHEGALLSVLVAVAAASREEWQEGKDGERFRRFLSRRMSGEISVLIKGQRRTFEWLLYKFYRNALIHEGALPAGVILSPGTDGHTGLHVVLGAPPRERVGSFGRLVLLAAPASPGLDGWR